MAIRWMMRCFTLTDTDRLDSRRIQRPSLIICFLLAASTAAVYLQTVQFNLVRFDDPQYLLENGHVEAGLTRENIRWAFTTMYLSNWHPITWLSYMLESSCFGINPGIFHATNVWLHVLNTLLLFGLLRYMTGRIGPSGFVAALFALHPLHVESVAWISERKDVLSTVFALLSMWAYVRFTCHGGIWWYGLSIVLLALGLMAKPMLVTLPFVFLLLDYWPLGRISRLQTIGSGQPIAWLCNCRTRLLEKVPFLLLCGVSCAITLHAQDAGGSVVSPVAAPYVDRIANAFLSYTRYLGKMVWPVDLSILYTHPNAPGGTPWTAVQVGAAGLTLLVVTVLVFAVRRRYAVMGWLWYLGTLVPVIGLIQVGYQAMADRYTYVPLIGPFIAIAWGAADLLGYFSSRIKSIRLIACGASVMIIFACVTRNWTQVQTWRNSKTLFEHAVILQPNNPVGQNNLGAVRQQEKRIEAAIWHYRRALEISPLFTAAHANLALVLSWVGERSEAVKHYQLALRMAPNDPQTHYRLAHVLATQGQMDDTIQHYAKAVALRPDDVDALNGLGGALAAQGRLDEAIDHFRQILNIDPQSTFAHFNLGIALESSGKLTEAVRHYRQALEFGETSPEIGKDELRAMDNRLANAAATVQAAAELGP